MKFIYEDLFTPDNAFSSGEELLEAWNGSEEYYYQMAFLDINMLGMDGYEVSQAIRQSERKDSLWIAVYAVSANILLEHQQRAMDAGMNGYVLKPIDYEELFDTIHCELDRQQVDGTKG